MIKDIFVHVPTERPMRPVIDASVSLFDKTGTLTVGGARLLSIEVAPGETVERVLTLGASLRDLARPPPLPAPSPSPAPLDHSCSFSNSPTAFSALELPSAIERKGCAPEHRAC
jgi:hypothetical protein